MDFNSNLGTPEKPQSFSYGTPIQRSFFDIDELASSIPEKATLNPLSLQPFQCNSVTWNFETIRFSFSRPNCAVSAVGDKNPDFLCFVCLPHSSKHPILSHREYLSPDHLYGFDLNRGVDMVFPEHSTHCAVYVRRDVFAACAEAMERPDLNARFFAPNWVYAPETLPPLKAYLKQLYERLINLSPLLQQPYFQRIVLQDFLPLLVTTLPLQQERLKKIPMSSFARSQLVKQAENYMRSHLDQPLTLTDLCTALQTSSRTLSYGFQQIFGMSPMHYLKVMRLMGAYRALKAASPSSQSITSIAHRFGFWSLGHFARDYKTMFRENPSDTLFK